MNKQILELIRQIKKSQQDFNKEKDIVKMKTRKIKPENGTSEKEMKNQNYGRKN